MPQERDARRVQVDADEVDARRDDRLERLLELLRVDVVLIEADADALGLDLDELGERVLEPPADRDRAAEGGVEVGELLAADRAGRVDARAGLVDDHVGELGEQRVGRVRPGRERDGLGPGRPGLLTAACRRGLGRRRRRAGACPAGGVAAGDDRRRDGGRRRLGRASASASAVGGRLRLPGRSAGAAAAAAAGVGARGSGVAAASGSAARAADAARRGFGSARSRARRLRRPSGSAAASARRRPVRGSVSDASSGAPPAIGGSASTGVSGVARRCRRLAWRPAWRRSVRLRGGGFGGDAAGGGRRLGLGSAWASARRGPPLRPRVAGSAGGGLGLRRSRVRRGRGPAACGLGGGGGLGVLAEGRPLVDDLGDQLLGLAAGGAVADGDDADVVLADQVLEEELRLRPPVLGRVRMDHRLLEQVAVAVEHGDLAAGPEARVDRQHDLVGDRRLEQQAAEVAGEDVDGVPLGHLGQVAADLALHAGQEQAVERVGGRRRGRSRRGGGLPAGAGRTPRLRGRAGRPRA